MDFLLSFFFLTMNYTHTVSATIISSMYTTILLPDFFIHFVRINRLSCVMSN